MIKYNLCNKIPFLIKIIFFFFIFSLKSYSDNLKINDDLVTLGNDKANIKIKIFSSFTCPHCANFHFNIVSQIKKNYVDTGKVQLIFIDFPLDQAAFNVSKLLHCTEKSKQINFIDNIYKNQKQWTAGSNIEEINKNIKKIVENLGISSTRFDKCLIDEDISDKILNGRIDASKKYTINSTPTIVINEEKLEGSVSFENIKKKIEKLI
jgi:protein-disulfide isomerase